MGYLRTVGLALLLTSCVASPIEEVRISDPGRTSANESARVSERERRLGGVFESVLGIRNDVESNSNYERLSSYPDDSRLRQVSEPVGLLYGDRDAKPPVRCTATIVDDDIVLTAYHCVDPGRVGEIDDLALVMGYYEGAVGDVLERYAVDIEPVGFGPTLDYALLRVKESVGERWGIARLDVRVPRGGESLLLVHHPGGLFKHVTRGRCRAVVIDPLVDVDLRHTCDTTSGSSGAPIFLDDHLDLIGIHSAGRPGRADGAYNIGSLISDIAAVEHRLRDVMVRSVRRSSAARLEPPRSAGGRECDPVADAEHFEVARRADRVSDYRGYIAASESRIICGAYSSEARARISRISRGVGLRGQPGTP